MKAEIYKSRAENLWLSVKLNINKKVARKGQYSWSGVNGVYGPLLIVEDDDMLDLLDVKRVWLNDCDVAVTGRLRDRKYEYTAGLEQFDTDSLIRLYERL